jgi:hypothetical protein
LVQFHHLLDLLRLNYLGYRDLHLLHLLPEVKDIQ